MIEMRAMSGRVTLNGAQPPYTPLGVNSMGIKDQFQDKANELKNQAQGARSDAREQGNERGGQRQDREHGGQRQDQDRRQGGQERGQQPRERGQQGRQPAQDAMDAAEGRFQS
ncbi:hypothetical protein Scani_67010 [Streptomyces caniferus]|uniref:Uncharacterized protein n=2 Tax=Streptomyces caniferus TaxID=285557 RepID=A0A640SG89_9ACTN|nr:hypothetical protein Scani_67010 [Streptomyces caniferus]